ncbi:DUF6048 family protein [Mangrovimonas sp. YM274]|uniref:DUF6048 family protein n=1 Tax=Mangrovimonas sp. YM274 TaxID=3070660 RepID=UPI0027DD2E15|nr:DUF6048 family protein [Mangrovimonas sp. YM274]WMI67437.1 DUF6048 family protein [Mangrovimonas sp. YM274]
MKQQHTSTFIIKILVLLLFPLMSAAQQEIDSESSDTLVYKQKYGLRIGADISKPIRSFIDDDYSGFEIVADYRLTQKLYLAGELGTEEKDSRTDFLDVTTKGSYFKAGVDYNMYTNWLDMQNMIYAGFRVGASTFSHTVNNYTIYNTDQYWNNQYSSTVGQEYDGLSAIWGELIIGIKAETFKNLFIGINAQLKGRITETEPDNFENIYIPGFNRTYDSGKFGMGFGYSISYLVPIFKKDKKVIQEEE